MVIPSTRFSDIGINLLKLVFGFNLFPDLGSKQPRFFRFIKRTQPSLVPIFFGTIKTGDKLLGLKIKTKVFRGDRETPDSGFNNILPKKSGDVSVEIS